MCLWAKWIYNSKQKFIALKVPHLCFFFLQQFEEDALAWEDKLNRINALFDVWIDVQRRWVYLEGIFTGSADIKHLLPVETQRFSGYVVNQIFLIQYYELSHEKTNIVDSA